ncbi:uncharacterized protein LAESUDRAFT_718541, partial [Laetiporus sulphureus 93-53]
MWELAKAHQMRYNNRRLIAKLNTIAWASALQLHPRDPLQLAMTAMDPFAFPFSATVMEHTSLSAWSQSSISVSDSPASTDLEVWSMTDEEIISLSSTKWKSKCYDHYNVSLKRIYKDDKTPLFLQFGFTCKFDPKNHRTHYRDQMKTGDGTKNLDRGIQGCCKWRGVEPTSTVHLIIDGWTAPFVASYLGIIIVWFDGTRLWRAILEFIRLTEKHTGAYLAHKIADCMHHFGLEKK